ALMLLTRRDELLIEEVQDDIGHDFLVRFHTKGKDGLREFGIQVEGSWTAATKDEDRKSTRLNSSHVSISYAVFCLKKKILYDYFGTREFTVLPWLRAVNSAATGTLAGTVTTDSGGRSQPVKNANITLCGSPACDPPNAYVVATGRSDDAGRYTVGFLRAGAYTVRVEQPDYPSLAPAIIPNVHIAAGDATQLPLPLPRAGPGGAYIRISGPTSVGVGRTTTLRAAWAAA